MLPGDQQQRGRAGSLDQAVEHSRKEFARAAASMARAHGAIVSTHSPTPHTARFAEDGSLVLTVTNMGSYDHVTVDWDATDAVFIVRGWQNDGSSATRRTLPVPLSITEPSRARVELHDGQLTVSVPSAALCTPVSDARTCSGTSATSTGRDDEEKQGSRRPKRASTGSI